MASYFNPILNTPQLAQIPSLDTNQNTSLHLKNIYSQHQHLPISRNQNEQKNEIASHKSQSKEQFEQNNQQMQINQSGGVKQEQINDCKGMDDQEDDQSLQSDENCQISQKLKAVINFLVKYIDNNDDQLYLQKMKCAQDDKDLGQVFDVLVRKFRKLKKTKQQMTKYCMRKAFKFLADKHKKIIECKDSGDFLNQAFSVPFKKNSQQKTMNTNFLKKVFSSLTFMSDYKQFLKNFVRLVQQDNNKKIKYLTSTIKTFIHAGSLKKLQTVKRLPWTQPILDKTIDLAHKLIIHSPYYQSQSDHVQKPNKVFIQKQKAPVVSQIPYSSRRKTTLIIPQLSLSAPKTSQRAFKRFQ